MSLYATASLLCALPGNVPLSFADMHTLGYRYMAPQGVNGTRIVMDPADLRPGERPMPAYQDGLHAAGLKCAPWQKLYGGTADAVRAEARACAEFIHRYRPDGMQVNPETEYKEDGYWRSRVYVDELQAEFTRRGLAMDSVEWAIQPLGGASIPSGMQTSPWAFNFDTEAWLELPNCWCLPEAYWAPQGSADGAGPEYRPYNCFDQWALKQAWPQERIGFTLGWWNSSFAPPDMYMTDLRLVRNRFPGWRAGYGIYLADQMSLTLISQFAAGVDLGYAEPEVTVAEKPPPTQPPTEVPVQQVTDTQARDAVMIGTQAAIQNYSDPKPKGRNTVCWRIANADDQSWNAARDVVVAALDKAGVPAAP